jgi:hypothetical protein
VLAIFAGSAREPNEAELKLMQIAEQLIAIVIERDSTNTAA